MEKVQSMSKGPRLNNQMLDGGRKSLGMQRMQIERGSDSLAERLNAQETAEPR